MTDAFKPFEQDARVRRVSRMIPDTGPLSDRHVAEVFEALRAYMRDYEVTQTELAAGLGESASTISALLTGSDRVPVHKRDELLRAANNWIEEDARQRAAVRPDRFHMTRIAKRIFALARETRAAKQMSLAYGPSGIGKTICAEALRAEIPGTMLVTGNRATRSGAGLVSAIYAASRRKNRSRYRPRFEDIVDVLKGSGRLLIVDQAHRLQNGAFELLMDLHDECDLPVMLLGTIDVFRRLRDDEDPFFGQLASRVMLRRDLFPEIEGFMKRGPGTRAAPPLWTADDIRAIWGAAKLKLHPEAEALLVQIGNYELGRGHLRRVDALVYWSMMIAAKAQSRVVQSEHVQRAIAIVEGQQCTLPREANEPHAEAATA